MKIQPRLKIAKNGYFDADFNGKDGIFQHFQGLSENLTESA